MRWARSSAIKCLKNRDGPHFFGSAAALRCDTQGAANTTGAANLLYYLWLKRIFDEPTVRISAMRRVIAESQERGMRTYERTWTPLRVAAITRPGVFAGVRDDARPHRVELDVPVAGENISLACGQARAISTFPEVARPFMDAVYMLNVVLVETFHEERASAGLPRREQQM